MEKNKKSAQILRFMGICAKKEEPSFSLTFAEIQENAGIPIDPSFLNYTKELVEYEYPVGKISKKEQTILFHK